MFAHVCTSLQQLENNILSAYLSIECVSEGLHLGYGAFQTDQILTNIQTHVFDGLLPCCVQLFTMRSIANANKNMRVMRAACILRFRVC